MTDTSPAKPRRFRSAIRQRLLRVLDDAVGARLDNESAARARADEITASQLAELREAVEQLADRIDGAQSSHETSQAALSGTVAEIRAITGQHLDRTPEQRQRLLLARESAIYKESLAQADPLVTVRIATYDRAEILFERTLPSVFAQTHANLEVIVVGDGSGSETERRAAAVTDPRFRFVNLPHRGVYPSDPGKRWLVAGSPAMNHGAQLAAGSWIAPLDDDDEFRPDHVQTLLATAREGAFEMVYGRMQVIPRDGSAIYEIGSYPPEHGKFGFQAALYLSALRFFEYETSSWVLGEPGDWNLCRRMLAAGVRIGYTEQVVTSLYPAGPS
jgi:hypothetical protein